MRQPAPEPDLDSRPTTLAGQTPTGGFEGVPQLPLPHTTTTHHHHHHHHHAATQHPPPRQPVTTKTVTQIPRPALYWRHFATHVATLRPRLKDPKANARSITTQRYCDFSRIGAIHLQLVKDFRFGDPPYLWRCPSLSRTPFADNVDACWRWLRGEHRHGRVP